MDVVGENEWLATAEMSVVEVSVPIRVPPGFAPASLRTSIFRPSGVNPVLPLLWSANRAVMLLSCHVPVPVVNRIAVQDSVAPNGPLTAENAGSDRLKLSIIIPDSEMLGR